MKWQNTAILAAVGLGIGLYIYFIERPKQYTPPDDKTIYAWNLSDLQAEAIDRVHAKVGSASATFVKLPPKATPTPAPNASGSPTPDPFATPAQPSWHMEGKEEAPLTYQWDSAWTDFKRMQLDRVVEEKPADEKIFEFASPSIEIHVGSKKEPLAHSLLVGKKAISGQGYYLKAGKNPKVYLVASYKVDNWKKLVSEPPVATPTPAPTPSPTLTPEATASARVESPASPKP